MKICNNISKKMSDYTFKEKGLFGIKVRKFSYFNGMLQVGYMYRFAR